MFWSALLQLLEIFQRVLGKQSQEYFSLSKFMLLALAFLLKIAEMFWWQFSQNFQAELKM